MLNSPPPTVHRSQPRWQPCHIPKPYPVPPLQTRGAKILAGLIAVVNGGLNLAIADDSLTFLKRRVCNGGLPHPYPTYNSPDPPLRLKPNEKEETIMDRMLVVVFDNESKAYEGSRSLQQVTVFTLHLFRLDPMILTPSFS
jgi:hypothetical protein